MNRERDLALWQLEQPQLIPLESVGDWVFPEDPQRIFLMEVLNPRPFDYPPFLLARVSREDGPIKTFLLGRLASLEELKGSNDSLIGCLEDFETTYGVSLERKLGGVVIFLEQGVFFEGLREELGQLVGELPFEARVWLVEPDLTEAGTEEKKARVNFLRDLGLVEVKSVAGKSDFLFSTGRLKKKRQPIEIDLTHSSWFKPTLRRTTEKMENAGWKVVDYEEAIEMLRASTNALRDYHGLIDGCGFKLEAPCGCQWQISSDGSWERARSCHDPWGCNGFPPQGEQEEYETPTLPPKEPPICFDCLGLMKWSERGKRYICSRCER